MKTISVILTAWKRKSIEEQLQRLMRQTLVDQIDIYVWQNETNINLSELQSKYRFELIQSSKNFKFHGRFTLPLLLSTEYTVILDDDTLPNECWLEKCVSLCSTYNCIVGGNGRLFNTDSKKFNEINVDDPSTDTEVDYVGHCWFFKTEWVRAFWAFPQPTFETGEDISFSAALKISLGVRSFVSGKANRQEVGDSDRWKYGIDSNASFTSHSIDVRRNTVFPYWRSNGWKLIAEMNK